MKLTKPLAYRQRREYGSTLFRKRSRGQLFVRRLTDGTQTVPSFSKPTGPLADLLVEAGWVWSKWGGRVHSFKVKVLRNRVTLTLFAEYNGRHVVGFVDGRSVLDAFANAGARLQSKEIKWHTDQFHRKNQ